MNGSVVDYVYDWRNRLTDVRFFAALGGSLTKHVQYAYDAIDRRLSRSLDSNGDGTADEQQYFVNYGVRASQGNAGDRLTLVLDSSGQVKTRLLHGVLVDEVLAEEQISGGNRDVLWIMGDHQGTVRDQARVSGGQVHVHARNLRRLLVGWDS